MLPSVYTTFCIFCIHFLNPTFRTCYLASGSACFQQYASNLEPRQPFNVFSLAKCFGSEAKRCQNPFLLLWCLAGLFVRDRLSGARLESSMAKASSLLLGIIFIVLGIFCCSRGSKYSVFCLGVYRNLAQEMGANNQKHTWLRKIWQVLLLLLSHVSDWDRFWFAYEIIPMQLYSRWSHPVGEWCILSLKSTARKNLKGKR